MKYRQLTLLVLWWSVVAAVWAYEQISFTIAPQHLTVRSGESAVVRLTMHLQEGWHAYGIIPRTDEWGIGPQATEVRLHSEVLQQVGKLKASPPKQKFDKGFQIDVDYYEDTAAFWMQVTPKAGVKPGKYRSALLVYYQICDSIRCLPPAEDTVWFEVTVLPSGEGSIAETQSSSPAASQAEAAVKQEAERTEETPPQQASSEDTTAASATETDQQGTVSEGSETPMLTESLQEIEEKKREGILAFLLFAMGAGALALLTPCVFPMIPITVSFFTKRAEQYPGRAMRDALVYTFGIVLTFTAIGFVISVIFGATGIQNFATDPWVNLLIAAIFVLFALNLFGAFEIRIPAFLLQALNRSEQQQGGIWGVLLMGLVFSITTFTCTVPFVGSALIAAASGEWFYPIIGMAGFSFVFAIPFFLLALFPNFLHRLPKAGGWMNNIKVVMGFLELAAALKFISNADLVFAWGILPREFFLSIWAAIGLLIALYILGFFRLTHDAPVEHVGATRVLLATFFGSVALYLFSGAFGASLGELDAYVPPPEYHELISGTSAAGAAASASVVPSAQAAEQEVWLDSYEKALEIARKENKPIFIDFTGFTCTNCRWMERNMFPLPEVRALLDQMVKVRLFTDRRGEPYESNKKFQQERFGSIELPLYVILTPDGQPIATKAFTRDKEEFIAFLNKALQR